MRAASNTTFEFLRRYDPFGMGMPARSFTAGSGENYRFGFNGKSNDDEVKGDNNSLDFGARIYDPRLGRWLSVDPLINKYPFSTSYSFALNSPLQAIDPDGRLVIFINGLSNMGADSPGNKDYWGSWANAAMDQIMDHNSMFIDGENYWTSGVQERISQGYAIGKMTAPEVIDNLARDAEGNIIETVKIITHSQGAATERGFSRALEDYVQNFNNEVDLHNTLEDIEVKLAAEKGEVYIPQYQKRIEGFEIEYVVDVSPWQGSQLSADPNAETTYLMRNSEGANTYFTDQKVEGSVEIGLDREGNPKAKGHHPSFFSPLDLPKDTDTVDDYNIIEYGNEEN